MALVMPMRAHASETSSWKKVFRFPLFLLANVAVFLFIGVSTLRETYRGWTVEREIRALESQAEMLEGRKLKLAELTEALVSPDRVELDARQRLRWKKDGERVVILTGYDATTTVGMGVSELLVTPIERQTSSNPMLWWKYFFEPRPRSS